MSQSQSGSGWQVNGLRVAVVAAIALTLLGAGSRLEATTVLPMDVAELSDQAEFIFTGTAVKTDVVLSKDGAARFTFVTFAVHDVLKGWTMEQQIALRFTGGTIGSGDLSFEGMPQFDQGEKYLLFVRGNGSVICPVLGWWQGNFHYSRRPGSAKHILLDSAGAPMQGIEQGRFKRGLSERTERATAHGEMTVISEEGVHVVLPKPTVQTSAAANERSAEAPEADQIVVQLRSFIAGRAKVKNFQPGRRVDSARTEDVPARAVPSTARPH